MTLKDLREKKGITKKDMYSHLGIHAATYESWENYPGTIGRRKGSRDEWIRKIANLLSEPVPVVAGIIENQSQLTYLLKLRLKTNFNRKDVAKMIGVSAVKLQKWEENPSSFIRQHDCCRKYAEKLGQIYNVSWKEIVLNTIKEQ